MESLRDVKRAMEREIKKGSCPLKFDRLEFGGAPFQIITSEEKLDEVLAYLLRVKSFNKARKCHPPHFGRLICFLFPPVLRNTVSCFQAHFAFLLTDV